MQNNEKYKFCPECGALMTEEGCMNCGYGKTEPQMDAGNQYAAPEENSVQADENVTQPDRNMGQTENSWTQGQNPYYQPPYNNMYGQNQNGHNQYGQQNQYNQNQYGQQNAYGQNQYGQQNAYNQNQYGQQNIYNQNPYGQQNAYGQNQYGQQNMYNQNPYGQPQPPKRNNTALVVAIIVAAITLLLCVAMVLVFIVVKDFGGSVSTYSNSSQFSGDSEDFWNGDWMEDYLEDGGVIERIPDSNYEASADDEFYETIVNAVRDDLSYSIEWEEYDYTDDETGATATGRYPQLVGGNIPNLDDLNEEIEYDSLYYSDLYNYYRENGYEINSYTTESIGYVTYMDEEKISIVMDEYFSMNGEIYVSLYCINIDLRNGTILDNEEMLDYDLKLAEKFRAQSDYQNGTISAVDGLTDEEIMDFLSDSSCSIVFYTPVGMEIGFNYTSADGSSGWVTATIKDYEKYAKKI